jgi:hypothetical protein
MTEPADHEMLSALLDREPVDPDTLAVLLEDAAARALLVDFVRLRFVLHADGDTATSSSSLPAPRRRSPTRVLVQIAAAIVLVALGAAAGRRFAARDDDTPPEPTRVVQLAPSLSGRGPR